MGVLEGRYCVLAASMKIRQNHGSQSDVGLVDRPIWQAVEEREPIIEWYGATNYEVR